MDGFITRWFRALAGRPEGARPIRRGRPVRSLRLSVEGLEERWTPTVYTVNNTNTSGAGSFPLALATAQADTSGTGSHTINFVTGAAGQTINLGPLFTLFGSAFSLDGGNTQASSITINAANATINGQGSYRIFEVNASGFSLTINDMTIQGGAPLLSAGGGILVQDGTTTLNRTTIRNNNGAGLGGGIAISGGTLNINDSTISGNFSTIAGGGVGVGGGIVNYSSVVISGNLAQTGGGVFQNAGAQTGNDVRITANSTTIDTGGGIRMAGGTFALTNSEISANITNVVGGGAAVNAGSLTLTTVTVFDNQAASGGGIHLTGAGSVNIPSGLIIRNRAISGNGGGIFFNGGSLGYGGGNVDFVNNSASLEGGGLYFATGSHNLFFDTGSSGNSAQYGGLVAINGGGSSTLIAGSVIAGNSASVAGGGVSIGQTSAASFTINGSTLRNNTSSVLGGAVFNDIGSTLTITDSVLGGLAGDGNSAQYGGGISNQGNAFLRRVTVSNNSAPVQGGGIYLSDNANLTVYNSTISSNTGMGIFVPNGNTLLVNNTIAFNTSNGVQRIGGTVTAGNTIFSNNGGGDYSGAVVTLGNNLVANPTGSTGFGGADLTGVSPGLVTLNANGVTAYPSFTHAFSSFSPAFNAGSNAVAITYNLTTDQRDVTRFASGITDIGAYEFFDTLPPLASLTTAPANVNAAAAALNTRTVVITYFDQVGTGLQATSGVDTTTFGINDLSVTNGATISGFSVSGNQVTYTIQSPAANWGASPQGTYVVSVNVGSVLDRSGNGIAAVPGITSFVVDTIAPTAVLTSPPVTINSLSSPTAPNTFTVLFTDTGSGLNLATIDASDFIVSNGAAIAPLSVSVVISTPTTASVVYSVAPPTGNWTTSAQGVYTIALVAGSVTDNFGNPIAGNANFSSFQVNTVRPFATMTTQPANITVANATPGTNTFTITYTTLGAPLNPATYGANDVTVFNGATILPVISVVNNMNAVTYTVQAPTLPGMWSSPPQGLYTISLNADTVFDTAGNSVAANPTIGFFNVDVYRPTATLTTAPATIDAAYVGPPTNTFSITYADSGPATQSGLNPSTFGVGNVTVTNGMTTLTVASAIVSGNTVTYTVNAPGGDWSTAPTGTYTVAIVADNIKDNAGNGIQGNASFTSFAVDLTRPTATLATPPANIFAGAATNNNFTVTFTETGSGLNFSTIGSNDFTATNGTTTATVTVVSITPTGSGASVVYTVNAPGGTWGASTQGTYTIALNAGSVADNFGNVVLGNPNFASFVVNTARPQATLTTPANNISIANVNPGTNTFTITYTNTGAPLNPATFGPGNVLVQNGANPPLTVISAVAAGNAVTYTVQAPGGSWLNPPQGQYTIAINPNSVFDTAGNSVLGNAALGFFTVDTYRPVAAMTTPPATINTNYVGPQSNTFTITYSDPGFPSQSGVDPSTFGVGNITVMNGMTALTVATAMVSGNAVTYTVLAPGGDWSTAPAGTYTIAIVGNSVKDNVGNGILANPNFAFFVVDLTRPTATLTTPPANINLANAGPGTNTVTITYADTGSGLNPSTFDVNDITVTNGMTTLPVTSISQMGNVVTYTITPTGGWAAVPGGTYTVALVANSVQDFAGNGVLGNASLATFTVDVVAPTPTVTPTGTLTNASPIVFTINFNEPVTGLTVSDFVITNGTAGTLTMVTASQYTLPVTPTADGVVTVQVVAGAVTDAAGNPSVASNVASVTSDRTGPIPSFSLPSTLATTAGPVTYTITWTDPNFSAVTLTAGQVILNRTGTAGGTVSSVTGTGNTRVVTITNIFGNGTISISLPPGTAVDTLGNLSPAAGPSTSFSVSGNRLLNLSQPLAPPTILPGTTYVYAIDYSNTGNQIAPNARIVVNVPTAYGTFVAAGSTPTWANTGGSQYQYSLGNLGIGAAGRVNFAVNYAANTPPGTQAVFTAIITDDVAAGAPVATSTVSFLIVDPNRARWGRCCG